MKAELLDMQTADGVELNGAYWQPERTQNRAVDALLILPGSFGAFYNQIQVPFATALAESGLPCLTLSTRGHDTLWRSRSGRLYGNATEIAAEVELDVAAALDALGHRGHRRICLLGHSLGGIKGYYLLGTNRDPRIIAFVALSAPRWRFGSIQPPDTNPFGELRRRNVDLARRKVTEGAGDEITLFDTGTQHAYYSPKAFLNLYEDDRYDLMRHAPKIEVPILALRGGEEDHVIPDRALESMLAVASSPHSRILTIPGAGHFYENGTHRAAVQVIVDWLDGLSAPDNR